MQHDQILTNFSGDDEQKARKKLKRTRLKILFLSVAILILLFSISSFFGPAGSNPPEGTATLENCRDSGMLSGDREGPKDARLASHIKWLSEPVQAGDKVRDGDTFETLLRRNGIDYEPMRTLFECARPIYNLNRVMAGRGVLFTFVNERLSKLEYEIDEDRTLCLDRRDSLDWEASVKETEYMVREREISGTIESSLYETVSEVSGNTELALKLSEIFAWQIDFHSDVQKGDRFKLIYEEKVHPKGMRRVGEIFAAVYESGQESHYAIKFENKNKRTDYFDLNGESMRRKFLRSPFKYMPRISSRFSYSRFHPILKIRRPHLGVDYAAPSGTPILALGDGKVTFCGRKGGFGKYVMIKHNGMYATSYGHLSRFAGIHPGGFVTQGQVIGYVGSTGLATGPHLDFRFYKNDNAVDPLKVDIPSGEPLDKSLMRGFKTYRDQIVQRLKAIGETYGPQPADMVYGKDRAEERAGGAAE
jgi:murein DD-endopeptidase MepM/ murein hydrolase activator NlpD